MLRHPRWGSGQVKFTRDGGSYRKGTAEPHSPAPFPRRHGQAPREATAAEILPPRVPLHVAVPKRVGGTMVETCHIKVGSTDASYAAALGGPMSRTMYSSQSRMHSVEPCFDVPTDSSIGSGARDLDNAPPTYVTMTGMFVPKPATLALPILAGLALPRPEGRVATRITGRAVCALPPTAGFAGHLRWLGLRGAGSSGLPVPHPAGGRAWQFPAGRAVLNVRRLVPQPDAFCFGPPRARSFPLQACQGRRGPCRQPTRVALSSTRP